MQFQNSTRAASRGGGPRVADHLGAAQAGVSRPASARAPARPERAAAERYKRFLFSSATSAGTIKAQAAKLLAGARELVPVSGLVLGDDETDSPGEEVTYEDLARVVEELLLENGFYDATRGECR